VLSPATGDFTTGAFEAQFLVEENPKSGALTLAHRITLTESSIEHLVVANQAALGCFVRCNDTYHTELRRLAWPEGRSDFAPGSLINRVTLRPIIWLEQELSCWTPETVHPEFNPPISLAEGDIVAIADESVISVGQAKLAPIESIFELDWSQEVPEGRFQVVLDRDRITILVAPITYETINLLRGQSGGRPVVMNAVYLPAVMEVLGALQDANDTYENFRWYQPFVAKCDAKGIDPTAMSSALETAQTLLDDPAKALTELVRDAER
jgi:hypothetical protein